MSASDFRSWFEELRRLVPTILMALLYEGRAHGHRLSGTLTDTLTRFIREGDDFGTSAS